MFGENSDRMTIQKAEQEEFIQKVIERVLGSNTFLDKIMTAVKDALTSRDAKINQLESKLEQQEEYSSSSNLRIFGIQETPSEKVDDVIKMCSEKLKINISSADIECCHRLIQKIN